MLSVEEFLLERLLPLTEVFEEFAEVLIAIVKLECQFILLLQLYRGRWWL